MADSDVLATGRRGAGMVPAATGDAADAAADRRDERLQEAMKAIADGLQKKAEEQVGRRQQVEDRWHTDLQQYHGKYDAETEASLKAANKSRLFVNMTRAKTGAWEARLSDMLFPTDDKNWGIRPTPVPENAAPPPELAAEASDPEARSQMVRQANKDAKQAASLMEDEIEDQLTECRYQQQARDVIHDAMKLGTGVMKGPVSSEKPRRYWSMRQDEGGQPFFELRARTDNRPSLARVDPWAFFPDMSARNMDECEFTFERHLLNKSKVRELASRPDFIADQIRSLLREGETEAVPAYLSYLRALTDADQSGMDDRYHVWEYRGPLDAEDMRTLCRCIGDEQTEGLIEDELVTLQAVVWFCQGYVLKFGLHHLDSGESIYSVFNFERDETSVFGFGVPYIMRAPQQAINGAWRMMMDNGDLAVGPQIVVNAEVVEPVDGKWELKGRKVWKRRSGAPKEPAIEVYNTPAQLADLGGVIELARDFAEDETSLPMIAQGDQGAEVTKTAQGMSMLMNSANVVFRRVVKNFDDDLTEPCIRRLYHWNMQFSDREEIKGDFEVDARGSSVLLTNEIQAQNLMVFANQFTVHPILGQGIKPIETLRKLAQSMHLASADLVMTDEELKEAAEKQAEGGQSDPELLKIQAQEQAAEQQRQFDADQAERQRQHEERMAMIQQDGEMMKLAQQGNLTLDQLRAKLSSEAEKRDSEERKFAAEVGLKRDMGQGI